MFEEGSLSLPQFGNGVDGDSHSGEDRSTKKLRFKDGLNETSTNMAMDTDLPSAPSWKDKFLGGVLVPSVMNHNVSSIGSDSVSDGDFDLLANNVQTTIINGVPTINFSGRVKEILFKEMELTVVIKLLGWSIGYNTLHNRIISLWKPTSPFNLMDIENGYYLVRFLNKVDYDRILSQGKILFGSPNKEKRKDLWDNLKLLVLVGNSPWVAISDFNAILSSYEKLGGMSKGRRCPSFGDSVEQAELHDLAGWVKHPDFGNFVKDKWGFSSNMTDTLTTFTHDLKEWNKSIYDHITSRKKLLVKELTKIQRIMDFSSSNCLAQVELKIRQELENVLRYEELIWKQKACCDWLHFRDCNTKFFHALMLQQRKHGCITVICNDCGDWLYNSKAVEVEANKFFHNLYGENPGPMRSLPPSKFPRLDHDDISFLGKQITNREIKVALFDMAPLKAPGSDGFHALFFQK
ncbi:hypothetical protein CXB51_011699 [Gossypium anomalum]|uniref:DUF4283 domain-containing protein n=1 Tax=Gossypium anomalum TaxID=47600 RepID=A0A8J5Z3N4_9ROSI|nr:hypothetical protein CXB51_011699 [Gossypium anomalum]